MVIGFSSTMGTRRRMNMASHDRKNKIKSKSESKKSGWDELAEMSGDSTPPAEAWSKMAEEMKDKEPLTWENMNEHQKKDKLSEDIHEFMDKYDFKKWNKEGFFKNALLGEDEPYYERRERKIGETEISLEDGNGYKLIARLEKIASENPELEERAEIIRTRIEEIDAHHGMTPKEYKEAQETYK